MIEENRNSIIIRNVDLTSSQYTKFERAFSLYDDVTHKYAYNVFKVIDTDIHIPASIGSENIQTYFPNDVVVKNFAGTPISTSIQFNMTHTPRDDIQEEALKFLQTIKNDTNKNRMLNLATGTGKTFVTISAISYIGLRTMIIVDTVDLAKQWKAQILFHSDITEEDIFILSGRESVELAKSSNAKIFIAIHATLNMLMTEDLNSINELNYKLKIGLRVFDECHVEFKNICMINSLSNVNYSIYLTATPSRSDYKEDILYEKVFKKIPSYNGRKEQREKYHKIVMINFDSHPDDKQKISVKTKYGFSLNKWANFIETDSCYKNYIDSLFAILNLFQLVEKNKKVAIMLPTIELINKTYDDLKSKYPDLDIGKFIGEVKPDKRAEELNKLLILTNQKIFGKAIDVPDLDCVINYVPLSSKVNVEQILGRLRNNPGHNHILIDVTDIGYTECKAQQKIRKRFYKKEAKEIKEIREIF